MASFTSLVVLFFVLSVINVDADVKMLNDKTCEVREDPTTYDPIEFHCKFQGAGLYVFEGRSSSTVEKLSMDRLTPLSFLNIPRGTGLQMVDLAEGSCDQIKAPVNVDIRVAGKPCVEATSTHQRLQSTHLPVNPSQADSSRTDPYLYTSVPVETTTDDEITKLIPVETTINDEITKPSSRPSEDTTMTNSNSTLQYGSSTHNVSSEGPGVDTENNADTTPWIISTITVIAGNIEVVLASVMTILYGIYQIIIFIHQLYNRPLNQPLPPLHGHLIPQLQDAHIPPPQQPVLQPVPQVQPAQQPVLQPVPQVQPAQQPQPVNLVVQPPQIPPHQQPNEQPNQQLRRSSRRQTPTRRLIVDC